MQNPEGLCVKHTHGELSIVGRTILGMVIHALGCILQGALGLGFDIVKSGTPLTCLDSM